MCVGRTEGIKVAFVFQAFMIIDWLKLCRISSFKNINLLHRSSAI